MSDNEAEIGFLRSFFAHRAYVAEGVRIVVNRLSERANTHDLSKLQDDEFKSYCRINAGVRSGLKFGTPEYTELIKREKEFVDLHFSRNRHHPERPRFAAGIDTELDDYNYAVKLAAEAMTFIDIIEMVVDWWAARKGYGDTRPWAESVELNFKSKAKYLSPGQLWLAQSVAELFEKETD